MVLMLKLWVEIALSALAGRWVLALVLRERAQGNVINELLRVVSRPVMAVVAKWLPGSVSERGQTAVAACLLILLWLAATAGKVWICLGQGAALCR